MIVGIEINALIGYPIGKSKNEISGCVVLSVLLGPIGWLIALALKGNLRKCPFCAEQINPEAKVCRYCGREVTPKPAVRIKHSRRDIVRDVSFLLLIALILLALVLWNASFKS